MSTQNPGTGAGASRTKMIVDFTLTSALTPEVRSAVAQIFTPQGWNQSQERQGTAVRDSLIQAYETVIDNVPPSPTRTRALNLISDARMLCNLGITLGTGG